MPTPLYETESILTVPYRVYLASDQLNDIEEGAANWYVGIGRSYPWLGNDAKIPEPAENADTLNQLRRELVALKKIYISDAALVVQRVDWANNGTIYDSWSNSVAMYATSATTNANGTVTIANNSTMVSGTGTTFTLDYANNSLITLPGDGINTDVQTREVVYIVDDGLLYTNANFTYAYTANTPQKTTVTFPRYVKNFYVRNAYDQVFICLDNNFHSASNDMPVISLGGQLPSNPYIITNDGYKWKYLYTMSSGMKQRFFTNDWMPVSEDINTELYAVNGRLDIIRVLNGGTGYNNTAASFNAPILNVIGDGTGANVTAQVDANGTIYGVNILNGGSGYTTATITANAGTAGVNANLQAVIGPQGGWGSNAALELGATTLMISVTLTDTEANTIPTVDTYGNYFTYRQISIIEQPQLLTPVGNSYNATAINYDMTTVLGLGSAPSIFINDVVFQSPNAPYDFANSTFSANVALFNPTTLQLHINNIKGTLSTSAQLFVTHNVAVGGSNPSVTVFSEFPSPVATFSGATYYVENRAAITRSPGQAENIKLILQF